MWEGLMGGLGRFASSGLGQTAIGAGLGYGLDRLAGGKGGVGALLGGAGGLLNYGSGAGGNMFGEGTGGFDATAIGGLFNQGQQAQPTMVQGLGGSLVPPETAIAQGLQPSVTQPVGLLDRVGAFGEKYSGAGKLVGDISSAYGNISGGMTQRDLAKSEIDYRNRVAAINEAQSRRNLANQAATNQAAIDAFNKSKLNTYYSA